MTGHRDDIPRARGPRRRRSAGDDEGVHKELHDPEPISNTIKCESARSETCEHERENDRDDARYIP